MTKHPEEMSAFFAARVDSYDDHMLSALGDIFEPFYTAVAAPVPADAEPVSILDLGAGTGAELEPIFARAPHAHVTCVDLSAPMLARLGERFAVKRGQITLIEGSYLDLPLPEATYHCAVAVMTMHHFPHGPKRELYATIRRALLPGGAYIEGDYYADSAAAEAEYLAKREQALPNNEALYHIDIPFTLKTQRQLLLEAGFTAVDLLWQAEDKAVLVART